MSREDQAARTRPSPTVPPPEPKGLNRVLSRNIHELEERRAEERRSSGIQERLAAAITGFAGTMPFAYVHMVAVLAWTMINYGLIPGVAPFDKSFVGLATIASVEGIFLTTFVLVSQNRDAKLADRRADLDLQINLLAEHEVTKLITLVRRLAEKQGVDLDDVELAELERDVAPEAVEQEIDADDRK